MTETKIIYDDEGNKKEEHKGTFENGLLNGKGEVIFYYKNGNKEQEQKGIFKNDKLIEGVITSYNKNGTIREKEEVANETESEGKEVRKVNRVVCLIISVFFGGLGIDRFMMGHVGLGILKLITFGGFGIWWLIDLILIATKYNFKGVLWEDGDYSTSLDEGDGKNYFLDENGYYRFNDSRRLVHRGVAYKEIYKKNRSNYPLRFGGYVIHHKDKNKLNNDISNLQIVTQEEHEALHNIKRLDNIK